jgi:hypothetical protein
MTAIQTERAYVERSRAWTAARLAEKAGTLVRPSACVLCGEKGKLEKHHPDYSKPLRVVYCCLACHRRLHAEMRAKARRLAGGKK